MNRAELAAQHTQHLLAVPRVEVFTCECSWCFGYLAAAVTDPGAVAIRLACVEANWSPAGLPAGFTRCFSPKPATMHRATMAIPPSALAHALVRISHVFTRPEDDSPRRVRAYLEDSGRDVSDAAVEAERERLAQGGLVLRWIPHHLLADYREWVARNLTPRSCSMATQEVGLPETLRIL